MPWRSKNGWSGGDGTNRPLVALTDQVLDADVLAIVNAYAAKGTILSAQQSSNIGRFISRLKGAGVWAALKNVSGYNPGLYMLMPESATSGEETINWLSPGTGDLIKNGSPTITVRTGIAFPVNTAYYDTGIPILSVAPLNHYMGGSAATSVLSAVQDCGGIDSAQSGYSMQLGGNNLSFRDCSALNSTVNNGRIDYGWIGIRRNLAASISTSHIGATISTASLPQQCLSPVMPISTSEKLTVPQVLASVP